VLEGRRQRESGRQCGPEGGPQPQRGMHLQIGEMEKGHKVMTRSVLWRQFAKFVTDATENNVHGA
jgi:hypothetical protein